MGASFPEGNVRVGISGNAPDGLALPAAATILLSNPFPILALKENRSAVSAEAATNEGVSKGRASVVRIEYRLGKGEDACSNSCIDRIVNGLAVANRIAGITLLMSSRIDEKNI